MTHRTWIAPTLLSLGLLAPLAAAQGAPRPDTDRPQSLPGAPGASEAVAARLALEHASADTFAHESLTTALAARLAEAVGGGSPADWTTLLAAEVEVVEATQSTAQRGPTAAAGARAMRVERRAPVADGRAAPGKVAAADAAVRVAARLGELGGVPPWKVKVLRSERLGQMTLTMLVKLAPRPTAEVAGRTTTQHAGAAKVRFTWRMASDAAADDPAVWRIGAVHFERVDTFAAAKGFSDVTATVLAGSPNARERLVPSIQNLRLGLDSGLGIGFLGHHGVAVGDVDGDGIDDLYLCQPGGLPDQLWLRRADGTAEEVAGRVGLDLLDATSSALFVDLDNDGDQDLVRTTGDALIVHVNRRGAFPEAHTTAVTGATSLAAADVDGDSLLDLFLCTYGSPYTGDGLPRPYHDARNGTRNLLLANRTAAVDELTFEDVTDVAGMGGPDQRFSFAASFEDFDDDGDQDLYVANDFGRNHLWRNNGTERAPFRFRDAAAALGVEDVAAGMGVTWADFDLDGRSDVYVSNMFSSAGNRIGYDRNFHAAATEAERAAYHRHAAGNSLFLGRDGAFEFSGAASLGLWAWGGLAFEMDGDGRPDLYVPNGFVTGTNPDDL